MYKSYQRKPGKNTPTNTPGSGVLIYYTGSHWYENTKLLLSVVISLYVGCPLEKQNTIPFSTDRESQTYFFGVQFCERGAQITECRTWANGDTPFSDCFGKDRITVTVCKLLQRSARVPTQSNRINWHTRNVSIPIHVNCRSVIQEFELPEPCSSLPQKKEKKKLKNLRISARFERPDSLRISLPICRPYLSIWP